MSAEAVKLLRGFYDYSAGRGLVEALAAMQYVSAGHAATDRFGARDFEFTLVRGEGRVGRLLGPGGFVMGMRNRLSTFESYVASVEDVMGLGDWMSGGVSRAGRVPIRHKGSVIWTLRGARWPG